MEAINPGVSAGVSDVQEEQLGFNGCVSESQQDETLNSHDEHNEVDNTPTNDAGPPASRDLESGIDMLLLRHRK